MQSGKMRNLKKRNYTQREDFSFLKPTSKSAIFSTNIKSIPRTIKELIESKVSKNGSYFVTKKDSFLNIILFQNAICESPSIKRLYILKEYNGEPIDLTGTKIESLLIEKCALLRVKGYAHIPRKIIFK
jgi:hypothetical protein